MNYEISPLRWYLKKAARRITIAAGANLAKIRRASPGTPQIRVLTYHRFSQQKFDPVAVRPQDFEQHLRWLKSNVDLLDQATFQRACSGDANLGRDAVLLTVDDGHRSFFEHAWPLLEAYEVPAILFVCPGLIETESPSRKFMTWDQLRTVSRGGITVASHGHSHRSLGRLEPAVAEQDVLSARAAAATAKCRQPLFCLSLWDTKGFFAVAGGHAVKPWLPFLFHLDTWLL